MIPQDSSTLDEPVSVTIKRDARAVMEKFLHVLIPRRNRLLLKDCEFLLCYCCLAPPIASKRPTQQNINSAKRCIRQPHAARGSLGAARAHRHLGHVSWLVLFVLCLLTDPLLVCVSFSTKK